ncbi:MAG: Bax inhibitor-1/YccA family protein [Ilumatobacteraceae bacterium]
MANPVLNERTMANWAPPAPGSRQGPIDDGPTSAWASTGATMTVSGTISATSVLFVLLLASAAVGWIATGSPEVNPDGTVAYGMPGLAIVGVIVGIGCAFGLMFKPTLARVLGPVYALAQGFFVGSVSRMFETFYDGIVVQAAGATVAVFGVMLLLYRSQVIKVTDRFRRIVVMATLGVMALYLVSFVISLFGASVSFLSSPSGFGILFSVFVAGLAAMNLALDFDFIERGVEMRLPKHFEWFAAFGLLVTVVWLYLELLRLLAKLRER